MNDRINAGRRLRSVVVGGVVILITVCLLATPPVRRHVVVTYHRLLGRVSLQERQQELMPDVSRRLYPQFEAAGMKFPPNEVAFLIFKDVRRLDLYCREESDQPWKFIKAYPVLGLSGSAGPKQAEGDRQVPEGIYEVEGLNPNSRFHVSIRLNYPNDFDRQRAKEDGRDRLGGDIMIHGGSASIGCLAMGDEAAEELFILAAGASHDEVRVIICPTDFRINVAVFQVDNVPWSSDLYAELKKELDAFCECN